MNLVPKLSLAFVAGVSIVLAANGYLRIERDVAMFDAARLRDDVLIGETLASAVETVWRVDGADSAQAVVSRANGHEGRVAVRWVWLANLDPAVSKNLVPGEPYTQNDSAGGELPTRRTFVRVTVPDPRPGAIEVSEPLDAERAYAMQTIRTTVETALMLDGFCILLALVLGAWIVGRPMKQLAEKARRVGRGDFGEPLHMRQNDEIADLAGEMNAMCDRLIEAETRTKREIKSRIEMLEQLRHADRLMTVGKLASGVAHEIGTPLNVVEARAAMIAEGTTSPSESVDYARVIVRATERITRIIRQLLTFARRETAEKSRCDVALLTKHTLELLDSLARKRNIVLRTSGTDAPAMVDADGAQIEQVLTNLVMNAIQASDTANGESAPIEVVVDQVRVQPPPDIGGDERDFVRVRVRDEGCGIAPETIEHVFEPFFTTKDVGEGTGLGLSISYGIVREHGGWLQVESRPERERGTEFSLFLARARTGEEEAS